MLGLEQPPPPVCTPLHELGHGLEEVICTWTLGGGNILVVARMALDAGPRLLHIEKTKKSQYLEIVEAASGSKMD
jgi:hypothetical protein